MAITTEQIKKLRELTGAGVLEAKRALEDHDGDFDKALAILKEKAMKTAAKKAERVARQGLVDTYVHGGGRIGVMVELNCETDFVARTPDFAQLAHDLALQIAATNPKYVSPNDIPAQVREEQRRVFADAAAAEGKSGAIVPKIVEGKMAAWDKEACLVLQSYIRDDSITIGDLIQAMIAKVGENIVVRRFARFELGE